MQKLDAELDKPLKIRKNTPKIIEHVKNARRTHINYKFGVIFVHKNIFCRMNKVGTLFWQDAALLIFSKITILMHL